MEQYKRGVEQLVAMLGEERAQAVFLKDPAYDHGDSARGRQQKREQLLSEHESSLKRQLATEVTEKHRKLR